MHISDLLLLETRQEIERAVRHICRSIKYALVFIGIYFIGGLLLTVTLANFFESVPLLPVLIVLGLPAAVIWLLSVHIRKKDKEAAKRYRTEMNSKQFSMVSDFWGIVCSKEFRMELGIWFAYIMLLCLLGWRIVSHVNIFVTLLEILGASAVYGVLDGLSWLYVHTQYLRDGVS